MIRAVLVAAFVLLPATAAADGFVGPPGQLWAKVEYSAWGADKKFAGVFDRSASSGIDPGDRIDFDRSTGGRLQTQSLALTAVFVPIRGLETGIYFPFYQRVEFSDAARRSVSAGTGDLRPWVALQLTPPEWNVGTSISVHAKIPLTALPAELETIPLSEGQLDLAIGHETTWWAVPQLGLSLSTMFRRRFPFVDGDRRLVPGDEVELGLRADIGATPWLWFKIGLDGLWSTGSLDLSGTGAATLRERRQVQNALAGIYLNWGYWLPGQLSGLALDASTSYALNGRDYPAGVTWRAGLAWSARMYDPPRGTRP